MRHRVLTALAVIQISITTAVLAQPPELPGQNPAAAPQQSDAGYSLQQKYTRVRYEKDGTGQRQLRLRVKVASEQAVRRWGQLPFIYASDTEALILDRVRVAKPDGTIMDDAAGAVQDLAVRPAGEVPVFVDIRQKQITVAALRPGDVLEIVATWTITRPVTPGHFWFEHTFTTFETVLDERLEIDLPAEAAAMIKVRPGSPAEENGGAGRAAGGRRIYRWATKHTSTTSATSTPPAYEGDGSPADVRLTSYKSWNEVARWFSGLMPEPVSQEVKAKAVDLTSGISDPARKIEAIYDYVAKEIRYVSLSFGIGRFAPHPPSEVLKNQYGDCKDKAALLASMLQAVGIDSLPVLLRSDRSLDEAVASPLELDHMITVAPLGEDPSGWIWMDPTAEVAPIGMLIPAIRDKRALLVGGGRHPTRLLRTPADPPFPPVDRVDVNGTVNQIGVLTATVKFALRGDSELLARTLLRAIPAEAVKEFIREMARQSGINGEFSDEATSDPASTHESFELHLKVRISGLVNWAAATSEMKTFPRPSLPYSNEQERRGKTTLELGSPSRTVLRATFELPDGYALQPPVPVKVANAGMTYASTYTVDGRRLVIEREFATLARTLDAASFGEYSAFNRAVEADAAQTVKIQGPASGVPAIPPDATAKELYSAALNAYGAKNYEAAVALWNRNTEIDPNMGDAWISLGLVYGELKRYDEAAASIQKQLDRDPFDKRAYRDLGRIHKLAGRLEPALKAYAKHVEINPLDGASLKTLAEIYLDLRRYAEAAAALDKGLIHRQTECMGVCAARRGLPSAAPASQGV